MEEVIKKWNDYNEVDYLVVKKNIKRVLKERNLKPSYITEVTPLKINAAYSYMNESNKGKPDFMNLVILAKALEIDVTEFFKQV